MTALKQEAVQMIDRLPEEKVKYVIQFIRNMESPVNSEKKISPKMQAFLDLEKMKLHVSEDFDYEKELKESRELKYGSIS